VDILTHRRIGMQGKILRFSEKTPPQDQGNGSLKYCIRSCRRKWSSPTPPLRGRGQYHRM